MGILRCLAIKNLKMNKKRTISTIIGIILSTALICGTATLISSIQKTLIQNAINESGYYHLKLNDVSDEEINGLRNNRDIGSMFEISNIGYGVLPECQNETKPYAKLYSMDSETTNELNFKLIEGRFAENKNEVVISNHIITNGNVKLKVGDKVRLDIGDRKTLDGYKLDRK